MEYVGGVVKGTEHECGVITMENIPTNKILPLVLKKIVM